MKKMISMSDDFAAKLKQKAKESNLSVSAYIRMVLIERWNKDESVQQG